MKKSNLVVILIIVAVIGLAAFGTSKFLMGDVGHVERDYGASDLYSKAEIKSAMDAVTNHFRLSYGGCTLTDLWYEETLETDDQCRGWATQYDAEDAILIHSAFDVNRGEGPFQMYEPDSTGNQVMWILVRDDDNGKWRVVGGGEY